MSMGITVEDFKYVRGVNDAEYIELLKNAYERQKHITSKAIAKLKEQPERKTALWIIRKWGDDAKCSNCGKTFSDVYDMENYDGYCRFCGRKMVGFKGEQGNENKEIFA